MSCLGGVGRGLSSADLEHGELNYDALRQGTFPAGEEQ